MHRVEPKSVHVTSITINITFTTIITIISMISMMLYGQLRRIIDETATRRRPHRFCGTALGPPNYLNPSPLIYADGNAKAWMYLVRDYNSTPPKGTRPGFQELIRTIQGLIRPNRVLNLGGGCTIVIPYLGSCPHPFSL